MGEMEYGKIDEQLAEALDEYLGEPTEEETAEALRKLGIHQEEMKADLMNRFKGTLFMSVLLYIVSGFVMATTRPAFGIPFMLLGIVALILAGVNFHKAQKFS